MKFIRPILSVLLAGLFAVASFWTYALFLFAFDANVIDTVLFIYALLAALFAVGLLLLGNRLRKVFACVFLNILCTLVSAFFAALTLYLLIMLIIELNNWGIPGNGYAALILCLALFSAALLTVSILCLRKSLRRKRQSV